MTKGYRLLTRLVGEAILGGGLNRKEMGLARGLYQTLKNGGTISPMLDGEKEPEPTLFERPMVSDNVQRGPAVAAKKMTKTVEHARDSAGYDGKDPL